MAGCSSDGNSQLELCRTRLEHQCFAASTTCGQTRPHASGSHKNQHSIPGEVSEKKPPQTRNSVRASLFRSPIRIQGILRMSECQQWAVKIRSEQGAKTTHWAHSEAFQPPLWPCCRDARHVETRLSRNASAVSDAPGSGAAGRFREACGARPIQLFEGSRPRGSIYANSMVLPG